MKKEISTIEPGEVKNKKRELFLFKQNNWTPSVPYTIVDQVAEKTVFTVKRHGRGLQLVNTADELVLEMTLKKVISIKAEYLVSEHGHTVGSVRAKPSFLRLGYVLLSPEESVLAHLTEEESIGKALWKKIIPFSRRIFMFQIPGRGPVGTFTREKFTQYALDLPSGVINRGLIFCASLIIMETFSRRQMNDY